MPILAFIIGGTLALIAALHVYWAFGGSWGARVALPTKDDGSPLFSPGVWGCLIVAGGLLAVASLCVARFLPAPPIVSPALATKIFGVLAGVFALRFVGDFRYVGIFRRVRHTHFGRMDAKFFTPLCGLYAAAFITLALA